MNIIKKRMVSNVNMCCFWCSECFDNVPVGIPMKKVDETYYMVVIFVVQNVLQHIYLTIRCLLMIDWEKI